MGDRGIFSGIYEEDRTLWPWFEQCFPVTLESTSLALGSDVNMCPLLWLLLLLLLLFCFEIMHVVLKIK